MNPVRANLHVIAALATRWSARYETETAVDPDLMPERGIATQYPENVAFVSAGPDADEELHDLVDDYLEDV